MNAFVFAVMQAFKGKLPKPSDEEAEKRDQASADDATAPAGAEETGGQDDAPGERKDG